MYRYFKGKVALITDGIQEMIFDTAKTCAKQGTKVIITDYNKTQAQRALHEINKHYRLYRCYKP